MVPKVRKSNISIQKGTFSTTAQSPTWIMGKKTLWNSFWQTLHNSIDHISDGEFLKHYQNQYKNHCMDSYLKWSNWNVTENLAVLYLRMPAKITPHFYRYYHCRQTSHHDSFTNATTYKTFQHSRVQYSKKFNIKLNNWWILESDIWRSLTTMFLLSLTAMDIVDGSAFQLEVLARPECNRVKADYTSNQYLLIDVSIGGGMIFGY